MTTYPSFMSVERVNPPKSYKTNNYFLSTNLISTAPPFAKPEGVPEPCEGGGGKNETRGRQNASSLGNRLMHVEPRPHDSDDDNQ